MEADHVAGVLWKANLNPTPEQSQELQALHENYLKVVSRFKSDALH
jgi:hypothetical protein